ncbi:MAG: hypothetical protein R3C52_09440 [Hyphomonadaceae bacterium]
MTSLWSRRSFLRNASLGAAGAAVAAQASQGAYADEAAIERARNPRFLIVLSSFGGANQVDAFLSRRESEIPNAATLNAYPDSLVQNIGEFRAIDLKSPTIGAIPASFTANQSNFVRKHSNDMMVITHTGTSVNHFVAQQRSINGNAAWLGRTLQEATALTYGAGYPIPNVHLVNGTGFTERGTDETMPAYVYGERAPTPNLWPLSLDGYKGVVGAPSRGLFEKARAFRNEQLDPSSAFYRTFSGSQRVKHWTSIRGDALRGVEAEDLITKLMLFPDSEAMPLTAHGLKGSEIGQKVREAFPNYEFDPLEAQAALAFMLLRYGVSVTVTLGPDGSAVFKKGVKLGEGGLGEGDIVNPPISFDFSHQANREVQALMWNRQLMIADRLITLLKSEEFRDGQSFWDRSMIYFATEFGRTRRRPNNAMTFGSGHELNNGSLIVSPFANGGHVLGGVDPDTMLTYGFDPETGRPEPGRHMTEPEVYSGIAHALNIDTSGSALPDMRAMRRSA